MAGLLFISSPSQTPAHIYAKHLPLSREMAMNLQSFGSEVSEATD
jgi:hypothetical protein